MEARARLVEAAFECRRRRFGSEQTASFWLGECMS